MHMFFFILKKMPPWHWVIIVVMTVTGSNPPSLLAAEQVTKLQASHRSGQTFITWKEVTTEPLLEAPSVRELIRLKDHLFTDLGVSYRVYRSADPISSLDGLNPIVTVRPLSGWNTDFYGKKPKKRHQAFRYVIKNDADPLPPGVGLYVNNPKTPGAVYYAVTAVFKGQENRALGSSNVLSRSVHEEIGQGVPVLQRVEKTKKFMYVKGPITLYYYVRWESPPNASINGKPFDYLIAIPPMLAEPAPVGLHLHAWNSSFSKMVGWWRNAEKGAILVSTNQIPYDWWTGYHDHFFSGLSSRDSTKWKQGVVRPYTQRRVFSFLDWVSTQWKVDLTRVFAAGGSMGGSGSAMLAIRYPEKIAWAISGVGVHIPSMSRKFRSSYAKVYGRQEWNVLFEDGTPVWDYFNDAWYLRQYPKKETGFISFSNGKNDRAIGWRQAKEFYQALQDTKRPHVFKWGQGSHGEKPIMPMRWQGRLPGRGRMMPIDIRTNQTLPAFTHSNLDDNPGNGDPEDGDPSGMVNAHLFWLTDDIVDEDNRWEMTVGVGPKAPQEEGVVDVTPRRCQRFRPQPGEKLLWTNTRISDGEIIESGKVVADQWGLVTLEGVVITKGMNRFTIRKADES